MRILLDEKMKCVICGKETKVWCFDTQKGEINICNVCANKFIKYWMNKVLQKLCEKDYKMTIKYLRRFIRIERRIENYA